MSDGGCEPDCPCRRRRTNCRTSYPRSAAGNPGTCCLPQAIVCVRRRLSHVSEVSDVVVAVHRGPFVLNALYRSEQLGTPVAVELAFGQSKSVPAMRKIRPRLGLDAVGDDDCHQLVGRGGGAADDLLGGWAVEVLLADSQLLLSGRAVQPGVQVGDGSRSGRSPPSPVSLVGAAISAGDESGITRGGFVQVVLPCEELLLAFTTHTLTDDDGDGGFLGDVLGLHAVPPLHHIAGTARRAPSCS